MSSAAETVPKKLVGGILALTLLVLALGGAVVALKLRPAGLPTTAIERDVEEWRRATIANPDSDEARVGLGLALLGAGKQGEARGAFEEALELNPKNWNALLQLGLLVAEESPERALALFARSTKNVSLGNKAVPLIAQADLLMQLGRYEEAAIAYRGANADVPYLFDGHFGLARALEELGDRKGAILEYQEAARFDPTNQDVADALDRLNAASNG